MVDAWSRERVWALVDPAFAAPSVQPVVEAILENALTDWSAPVHVHVTDDVQSLLLRHRVAAALPAASVQHHRRAEWRAHERHLTARALRLRSVAIELLDRLDAVGVEVRVLKGLATRELDYPEPGFRDTGDVDLAVRPGELDMAVDALRRTGCTPDPEPFPSELLYGERLAGPHGVEVDLHTRLFRRSLVNDRLFDSPGQPLEALPGIALSREHRLVHAVGHFIISPPGRRRLSGVVDVVRLLAHPDLDLAEARRFSRDLRVERLCGAGLRAIALLSKAPDRLAELDDWARPDWHERATRLVPERSLVLDHLGRFREVPPGARLRYLPKWLVPQRRQWVALTDLSPVSKHSSKAKE